MTPIFSLRVTVALGDRRVALTHIELVRILGADAAGRLVASVAQGDGSQDIHSSVGERGGRGSMGLSPGPRTNGIERLPYETVQTVRGEGSRGEEDPTARNQLADYVADALQDSASLRFFRLVAATVPPEIIRDCLSRALDVPRRDVRRSRGAIFTKLILPYVRRFSS